MELINEIERLKDQGYSIQDIATKLVVSDSTVKNLTALKRAGEERLLLAAINGKVPLSVAMEIAKADTPEAQQQRKGLSRETIARLEDEMAALERDFKAVEAGYGQNVLRLTLASTYIRSLLKNPAVARFLSAQHPGIFAEFDTIAKAGRCNNVQ